MQNPVTVRSALPSSPTTDQVWEALSNGLFGVLAFANRDGHPRTAGVCYTVEGRALYISTAKGMWKVRHIAANPNVSMTVTFPKRVPFLPFIKVPAATVTFKGEAQVLEVGDIDPSVYARLPRGKETDPAVIESTAVIQVVPQGEFVTFGIGMPITRMRKHEAAHGRAACGT